MSNLSRHALALMLIIAVGISMADDPELRNLILSSSVDELEMDLPDGPWTVVMETGLDNGSYTLVAIFDGTASIYFSNGGGIIGAGEHAAVAEASTSLVSNAHKYLEHFSRIDAPAALPDDGDTVFYVRDGESLLTSIAKESVLGEGDHPLSNLFYEAHTLITAIRATSSQDSD